jgi:hypothetical protein
MATIDEFALKNIGLWWRYGISRHCDEWKYIIIGRIFESEIILIPPYWRFPKVVPNGSYRNTDEVWWKYGISWSCDECYSSKKKKRGENLRMCTRSLPSFPDRASSGHLRSGPVTSLPVTWLMSLPVMRNGPIPLKYDLSCTHIYYYGHS